MQFENVLQEKNNLTPKIPIKLDAVFILHPWIFGKESVIEWFCFN